MPEFGPWQRFRRPAGERHEDDRLSALLDDELPEAQAIQVTRHLASCERCLEDLESVRRARLALRALPAMEPPRTLYGDVLAAASRGPASAHALLRFGAAAAASAALLATAAFLAGDEAPGTVNPPVDVFVVDHIARVEGGPLIIPVDLSP